MSTMSDWDRRVAEVEAEQARLARRAPGNEGDARVADNAIKAGEETQPVQMAKSLVRELDELRSNVFHTGGRSSAMHRRHAIPPSREAMMRAALATAKEYPAVFAAHIMQQTDGVEDR